MEHQAPLFTSGYDTTPTPITPAEPPTSSAHLPTPAPAPTSIPRPPPPTAPSQPSRSADPRARLLLTELEAAKALSISPRTLWTLRNNGDIPHVRLGRAVRYDPDDLATWVKDRRTTRTGNN